MTETQDTVVSQEKFDEMVKELEYLKTERRTEIARNLEYARSLGDLSENAEYQEARELQAATEERIRKLEELVKHARIQTDNKKKDVVGFGSKVSITKAGAKDAHEVEMATRRRMQMPHEVVMRHRPPHFSHIFSGDSYAAGYYSYLWSEVLDADGFTAFDEAGDPFDPPTAQRLYTYVYSAGGTRDFAEAYRLFRGRDPDIAGLLKQRGLDALGPIEDGLAV